MGMFASSKKTTPHGVDIVQATFKLPVIILAIVTMTSILILMAAQFWLGWLRVIETYLLVALCISPIVGVEWYRLWHVMITWLSQKMPASVPDEADIIQRQFWPDLFGVRGLPLALRQESRTKGALIVCGLLLAISLGNLQLAIIMAINAYADKSEAIIYALPLEHKYSKHRKNTTLYYLQVRSPVPPPWPFVLDAYEAFSVNRQEYEQAVIGQTIVSFPVRAGALKLPWMARRYSFALRDKGFTLSQPQSKQQKNLTANQMADVRTACHWHEAFSVARDIAAKPPTDFRRDYWPNQALRTEEPLVQGVPHGIAHYWWDNGKPYAVIPYRQGKKHGAFTLYRPDQTVEARFAYQDGQMYGVNEWYDTAGVITHNLVYLRDGTILDAATACQK
jgi:hypothetical protein